MNRVPPAKPPSHPSGGERPSVLRRRLQPSRCWTCLSRRRTGSRRRPSSPPSPRRRSSRAGCSGSGSRSGPTPAASGSTAGWPTSTSFPRAHRARPGHRPTGQQRLDAARLPSPERRRSSTASRRSRSREAPASPSSRWWWRWPSSEWRLLAIFDLNAGAVASHAYAKRLTVATMLARSKMTDLEQELYDKGFDADDRRGTRATSQPRAGRPHLDGPDPRPAHDRGRRARQAAGGAVQPSRRERGRPGLAALLGGARRWVGGALSSLAGSSCSGLSQLAPLSGARGPA